MEKQALVTHTGQSHPPEAHPGPSVVSPGLPGFLCLALYSSEAVKELMASCEVSCTRHQLLVIFCKGL